MPKVLLLSLMYPRSDNPNLGILVKKQAIALARLTDIGVLAPAPLRPHVTFGNMIGDTGAQQEWVSSKPCERRFIQSAYRVLLNFVVGKGQLWYNDWYET